MYTLPCTIFIRERSCDVCYPIRIENYCLRVKMAAPCEPVDASTSSALPKLLRCVIMHVTSMKFENFTAMTNLRQTKPILCAKEWIKLSGGDREIADQNEVIQLLRGTDCNQSRRRDPEKMTSFNPPRRKGLTAWGGRLDPLEHPQVVCDSKL